MPEQCRIEAGLIKGQLAGAQSGHPIHVYVKSCNPRSLLGEGQSGGKSDEAEADNGDHGRDPECLRNSRKRFTPSSIPMAGAKPSNCRALPIFGHRRVGLWARYWESAERPNLVWPA